MGDNLTLEALARIQALDASQVVTRFRDKWTGGAALEKREAIPWMRQHLGAPHAATDLSVPLQYHVEPSRNAWVRDGGIWQASSEVGDEVGTYRTSSNSAMRALGNIVCALGESFGREWMADGALFVLSDRLPVLRAASYLGLRKQQEGGLRNVSGPLSEEMIIFVRPQATIADVGDEYQRALRRLTGAPSESRERNKPVGSPRVRDLAVLGARIARGEFASWPAAMANYNLEHNAAADQGDNEYDDSYRISSSDREDDPSKIRRFRKDVREAYRRVTGLTIDWQPARRGGLPEAILNLDGKTQRIPTAKNVERAESDVDDGQAKSAEDPEGADE
jgi:hypothetical protein